MIERLMAVAVLVASAGLAQDIADFDLARLLSNDDTRKRAIEAIVNSRSKKLHLLLSWSRRPPAHVDEFALRTGLIDAFGELKSREAIPFLIKNISVQRTPYGAPNVFMKTEETIESRVPAVAALVKVGPDCLPALYEYYSTAAPDDRLAVIVIVSRIAATMKEPESPRGFLSSVAGQANMEHFWAEEGLKHLNTVR